MSDISTNLTTIQNSLKDIKSAILQIGQTPTGNITTYADAIRNISGSLVQYDKWIPNALWWDIKSIIDNDDSNLPKYIALFYAVDDSTNFSTSSTNCSLIKFSDGTQVIPTTGQDVIHQWDISKDKPISNIDGEKLKTRYAIFYYNQSDPINCSHILAPSSTIYIIFDCDLTKTASNTTWEESMWFRSRSFLEKFNFINNHNFVDLNNWNYFCYDCFNLRELSDYLNTNTSNTMQYFCGNCFNLLTLPDINTSKVQLMFCFCYKCYSLLRLPEYMDLSSCYHYGYFCSQCFSLKRLMEDATLRSSINNMTNFCYQCYNLEEVPTAFQNLSSYPEDMSNFLGYCVKLKKLEGVHSGTTTSSNTFLWPDHCFIHLYIKLQVCTSISFGYMRNLSMDSIKYMADNADSATSTPYPIVRFNVSLQDKIPYDVLTTFTNKNWVVQFVTAT